MESSDPLTQRTQELLLKIGTWPSEPMRLTEDQIDDLLLWCVQQKSSDTTLQTDRPVYIEVDGILFPVTRRARRMVQWLYQG